MEVPGPPPLPRRMTLVVALVLLAPVCTGYLIGYDQIVGQGAAIIFMASPPPGATAAIAVLLGLAAFALTLAAGCLLWWSGRRGWNHRHVLAPGGAALVVDSAPAFVVGPIGGTSYAAGYAVAPAWRS